MVPPPRQVGRVSRGRSAPLYKQVEDRLTEAINSGEYAAGAQLPSETDLCEIYGVSRVTIRHAIRNLVAKGLIALDRGRGTFVRDARLTAGVRSITSFTEEMRRVGRRAGARVLDVVEMDAPADVAEELEVPESAPLLMVERVRTGDDEVIGVQRAYLPAILVPDLKDLDLTERSLYEVLEETYGIIPLDAIETFRVRPVTAAEAKALDTYEGDCAFVVRRVTRGDDGPIEVVDSVMRGDRYQVRLALHRP